MTAIRHILLVVLFTAVSVAGALAQDAVGSITAGSGEILVIGSGGEEQPGSVGTAIDQYDTIYVGEGGEATVTFVDDTLVTLSGGSALTIDELVYDPGSEGNSGLFTLVGGTLGLVSGEILKSGDMTVTTPVSTIGIRGTGVLIDSGFYVSRANGQFTAVVSGTDGETITLVLSEDGTIGVVAVTNNQTGAVSVLTSFGDTVVTQDISGGSTQFKSVLTPSEINTKFRRVLTALTVVIGKDLSDPSNAPAADELQDSINDLLETVEENPSQDASPD